MEATSPRPLNWKAHLTALAVSAHLLCVLMFTLPSPPVTVDSDILEHPEVKAELDHSFRTLHAALPWRDTPEAMRDDGIALMQGYQRLTNRLKAQVSPYLRWAGITQSWHMFGGTPPRFPLIMVIEVQPRGESYVLYQDLRWGTADSRALNFRHRKTHELLAVLDSSYYNAAYAEYWARRWNQQHPNRPAERVRLSFDRLTTPAPEDVRAGERPPPPEHGVNSFEWECPL